VRDIGGERQKAARDRRLGRLLEKKKTKERREGWIMEGSKKQIRRGIEGREENI
jgi:hypothetical protein